MANNCWYCRKGGIVDLYFAGKVGVCPSCGKGVNVQFDAGRFIALDNITTEVDKWVKGMGGSEPNEPLTMAQLRALPDGTTVYCYRLENGELLPDEWEVRRTKQGNLLKRNDGHLLIRNIAVDSKENGNKRRCFLKEVDLNGGNSGSQRDYKVGDRVVSEAGNIRGYNDQVGVIVDIDLTYDYPYAIDFGKHTIWCKVKCLADDKPDNTKWRVVNRKPEKGDYIRITKKLFSFSTVGEILKVDGVNGDRGVFVYAENHPYDTRHTGKWEWNYGNNTYEVVEKVEDWEWEEEIPF